MYVRQMYDRQLFVYILTTFPFFVHDLLGNGMPTTSHSRTTSEPQTTFMSRGPWMICAGAVTRTIHHHHTTFTE